MSDSLSGLLADALISTRPQSAQRQRARDGVVDYFACLLPVQLGLLDDAGLAAVRRVYPARHSADNHALQLGYLSHALDFDDYHASLRGHPSTVVLSTLLALTDSAAPVGHAALLDAYVIGVELAGRLGRAIGTRHYAAGLHSTATLGVIAAAGAACRLLQLNRAQTQIALGLAATQAAGLRAQFGSAGKALHAGFAARQAVNSVQLAGSGFVAQPDTVLEAFFDILGLGAARPDDLLAGWGAPWRIDAPGLEFKRYPTCGGTHSAIEAAFVLRASAGFDLNAVQAIEVSFPPGADTAPSIRAPQTGVQGRFSLEYTVADALLHGAIALERYGEQPVDIDIAELAAKVRRVPDLGAPADELDPDLRFHRVTLHLADGRTLSHCVTRQQTAATPTDVRGKLRANLHALPAERLDALCTDLQLADDAALQRLVALIRCP
ncbi:MmgE/PrpD family protein [Pseudomonas sp. RP23018S]|uniref:MmgE/PrpD family protein n=1 Tax=Pseudomonas sp. RP23018S TaxID=3096037 RepID=UPI002ACAC71E|nr:MmgE/PrpD family protein [Pseudomonas sp. RP23018S]MDZ5602737.1 MmgE/PrpD family protein [Pseudomonas sp. RP23018S]